MGWRFGFRRKLFGNLQGYRATHRVPAATKMYPSDCTADISVMGLFIGVTEEEASNQ